MLIKYVRALYIRRVMEKGEFPKIGRPVCRCEECSFQKLCRAELPAHVTGCLSGWSFTGK